MAFIDWIRTFWGEKDQISLQEKLDERFANVAYKYIAVNVCINFIASTLSLAEFQTKSKGVEVKGTTYYRLNVEPNKNTGAAAFWRTVIEKLVHQNECLVVKVGGEYLIAESFERQEFALTPNRYAKVVVGRENPYELSDVFYEDDVFFFRWTNLQVLDYVNIVYNDLLKLIDAGKDNYMMLTRLKILIKQSGAAVQTPANSEALENLLNTNLKRFLNPANSNALPLRKDFEYEDVSRKPNGTSSNVAREMRAFINDGFDLVAMAFQIPPQLLKGEVAGLDDAFRMFMTVCIKPIANIVSDELNRKLFGMQHYVEGTKVFIDTTRVRYVDVKDIAPALEALTRIGANTIDDNLIAVGREEIGGEVGSQRWMTKNYQHIEDFALGVKA